MDSLLEKAIREELADAVAVLGPAVPYQDTQSAYLHGKIDALRYVLELIDDAQELSASLRRRPDDETAHCRSEG